MKTVFLKLKEPVEAAKYKINDIICDVYDVIYCETPQKIITHNETTTIKIIEGDVYFSYTNDRNFNEDEQIKLDTKQVILNKYGFYNENQYLYIHGTGKIIINSGEKQLYQIGAYNSWGSGIMPISLKVSDMLAYHIDSISIFMLCLDRDLDSSFIFNAAFCTSYIDFMNKDYKIDCPTVYTTFKSTQFINKPNDDYVYIRIQPKQENNAEGFVNYEMNNMTRFRYTEGYINNNIQINIYSNLYFDTQKDVDNFITYNKNNIKPSKNITIYPKPSIDTTEFLSRNITNFSITFEDYN